MTMNQLGKVVHISGQDSGKQNQFVTLLNDTLQKQGYHPVELSERQVREILAPTEEDLLVRVINWASTLLTKSGCVALVSVTPRLGRALVQLPNYVVHLELTTEEEFVTSANQRLNISAEAMNLPQEIAQSVLLLEKISLIAKEASLPMNDNVYSAEEEAALQEHLRSLGYL